MGDLTSTPQARQYLAERRAEAVQIVTGGDRYTPSQRELAWAVLTGMPQHPRRDGREPGAGDGPEAA